MIDEDRHHVGMSLGGRPHQRRLILRRLLRVHVGAPGDQHADGVGIAGAGARDDRRFAGRDRRIRIGTGAEQPLDQRGAGVGARQRQRRRPKVVRRIDVGAGADEQIGGFEIVPVRGPQQRGRAVVRPHVDVDALLHQQTDRLLVFVAGRVDEPQIAVRGPDNRSHQECESAGGKRATLPAEAAPAATAGAADRHR